MNSITLVQHKWTFQCVMVLHRQVMVLHTPAYTSDLVKPCVPVHNPPPPRSANENVPVVPSSTQWQWSHHLCMLIPVLSITWVNARAEARRLQCCYCYCKCFREFPLLKRWNKAFCPHLLFFTMAWSNRSHHDNSVINCLDCRLCLWILSTLLSMLTWWQWMFPT